MSEYRFYVGQDVVCVRTDFEFLDSDLVIDVVVGRIYKISYIIDEARDPSGLGLGFVEADQTQYYGASAFRPVITDSEERDMEEALKECLEERIPFAK